MIAGAAFDILIGRQRSPKVAEGPDMVGYLRAANIKDGYLDLADVKQMNFDSAARKVYGLQPGDVLVSEGSGSADAVGASAQWHGELPGDICFQNTLLRYRARDGITLPGFTYQWCRWAFESGSFRRAATGTNILHIGAKRAAQMDVLVPPLPAQQRLVDLMTHLDGQLDLMDAESRAADSLWWALASQIQQEAAATATVLLGDISDISGGITKNAKTRITGSRVTVPYLRVANVHRRYLDLADVTLIETSQDVLDRLRLQPGDVLMNEGGDKDKLGRGAVWRGELPNCIHQNHVFRVRVTDAGFSPEFLSSWANSFGQSWFETYGTQTTGIASISKSTLAKFPVPALPLEQQQSWAGCLDETFKQMRRIESAASALRDARSIILDALLTGAHEIPDSYDALLDEAV